MSGDDDALHRRRALGLGAAATLLYLLTPPAIPNLDGLGYLKLLPHNFAAGHWLYMPALRLLTRVVGDGLRAGRLYDAILGGTGVVLFYGIARRFLAAWDTRAQRRGALWAAVGLALSYGYWSEANDLEAYAAAMVALLATVRLTLAFREQPTTGRAFATGLLLGVAVLSHLTHVLLALFVARELYLHARGRRLWPPAVALATGGALSLLAYAYAAFAVRVEDLAGAAEWIGSAQHGFVSDGGVLRLADAIYGLCKAIVCSPYLYEADAQKLVGQFLLGLLPLVVLVVGLRDHRRVRARLDGGALLSWAAPYTLLGVLFFGADPERWIFILPVGWILAAAVLVESARPLRNAVVALAWVGLCNLTVTVWPAHQDQWPRQKAEATATYLHDGDLLIFPGHSWDEYVSFYGQAKIEPFPLAYYAARDGVAACWSRLDKEVAAVRARGGRVFAVRVFDDEDQDPRGFWELASIGLSREGLKVGLSRRLVPVSKEPMKGLVVTRLDPPPGA